MEVQLINESVLDELYQKAQICERLRHVLDLRTTLEDGSQRMLNVLVVGTHVPIHRHSKSAETTICLEGNIDVVFYEELPNLDAGGPIHDGEKAIDETCFAETARFNLCPVEKRFGVQIPKGVWHTVEVHVPTAIFEAKDGRYGE